MFVVLLLRNNMGKCFVDLTIKPGVHEFFSGCLCYLRNMFLIISLQIREINEKQFV